MLMDSNIDNRRSVEDVFMNIYDDVVWKRNKVSNDERQAYYRLMASLENAGKKDWRKTMIGKVVEVVVFCVLAATLAWSLSTQEIKNKQVRTWEWIVMAMVIVSGLSVVRFLTFIVSLPMKRWWLIHKYVVYLITGLKWSVDITLYLVLLLLVWRFWFMHKLEPEAHGSEVHIWIIPAHQVTWFLVALCAGSILWLLKNTFYMILEANICYLKLFERIRYTIPSVHAMNVIHNSGIYKWDVTADGLWMYICIMKRENVPIWILQRLSEEYLHQFNISRPELMLLSSTTGVIHDDFKLQMDAAQMFVQIKTRNPARLPDWDYQSMHALRGQEIKRRDLEAHDEHRSYASPKELDFIFQPRRLFKSIDDEVPEDDSGSYLRTRATISFDEFLQLAVKGYKVSAFLKHNLEGLMKMFVKLNRLLNVLVLAIVLFSWLLLSQTVTTGQLALLFSPFLAASFIFGDSCKRIFNGFIFAFAMHPFEVGDRVIINNEQMRVTDLNLLTSSFIKYETGEEVLISNTTLMSINITNTGEEVIVPYSTDNVEFTIDAETPLEEVQDLEAKILMLMNNTLGHYEPRVVISQIGKEHIKMMVVFSYPNPTLAVERKNLHKSTIFRRLVKLLKEAKEVEEYEKYFTSYHIVEIGLRHKVKMKDIDALEAQILSCEGQKSQNRSNVNRKYLAVLMELTKSTLKMGLYLCDEERRWSSEGIAERLTAMRSVVRNVKIYQADHNGSQVYAKPKRGWRDLRAKDIIRTARVDEK